MGVKVKRWENARFHRCGIMVFWLFLAVLHQSCWCDDSTSTSKATSMTKKMVPTFTLDEKLARHILHRGDIGRFDILPDIVEKNGTLMISPGTRPMKTATTECHESTKQLAESKSVKSGSVTKALESGEDVVSTLRIPTFEPHTWDDSNIMYRPMLKTTGTPSTKKVTRKRVTTVSSEELDHGSDESRSEGDRKPRERFPKRNKPPRIETARERRQKTINEIRSKRNKARAKKLYDRHIIMNRPTFSSAEKERLSKRSQLKRFGPTKPTVITKSTPYEYTYYDPTATTRRSPFDDEEDRSPKNDRELYSRWFKSEEGGHLSDGSDESGEGRRGRKSGPSRYDKKKGSRDSRPSRYDSDRRGADRSRSRYDDDRRGPRRPPSRYDDDRGPRRSPSRYDDDRRGPRRPPSRYDDDRRGPRRPPSRYDDDRRGPRRPPSRDDDDRRGPRRSPSRYDDDRRGSRNSAPSSRDGGGRRFRDIKDKLPFREPTGGKKSSPGGYYYDYGDGGGSDDDDEDDDDDRRGPRRSAPSRYDDRRGARDSGRRSQYGRDGSREVRRGHSARDRRTRNGPRPNLGYGHSIKRRRNSAEKVYPNKTKKKSRAEELERKKKKKKKEKKKRKKKLKKIRERKKKDKGKRAKE